MITTTTTTAATTQRNLKCAPLTQEEDLQGNKACKYVEHANTRKRCRLRLNIK